MPSLSLSRFIHYFRVFLPRSFRSSLITGMFSEVTTAISHFFVVQGAYDNHIFRVIVSEFHVTSLISLKYFYDI